VSARRVNRRVRLLVAVFAIAFACVLGRAGWLQAVRAGDLDRLAANQHRETIELPAIRGTIFDRTGVELAIGERAVTIYANPKQVRDPRAAAIAVGHALGVEPGTLLPLLTDRTHGFVYLARKADPAKAAALEQKDLVGIGFYPEQKRTYPLKTVASEVVGYAGVDNHGLAGLELALDKTLAGHDGSKTIIRDPLGHVLSTAHETQPENGKDVRLTIDNTIQRKVEQILAATRAQWNAKAVTALVLDPRTGGILAMAVEPGFDANRFPSVPKDRQRNRIVTDTYEPGSTFKLVTMTGALETGMVTPQTRFTLPYSIQVSDRVIHDAESRGTETMSVQQILTRSSNVGTITVALGLGRLRLADWIDKFGFGHPTGVEYPGESGGIVLPPDKWSGSTIGNVPIGQGIAVTPLQMARAYATVANGGVAVQPHLVDTIGDGDPRAVKKTRIMSPRTAEQLNRMLRLVVGEGTGVEAQIPGYVVAGKTGTAAKADPVHGGYSTSKYVGSFVGFAPARNPRVVVLVTVDEPSTIWGGVVAAPAFKEITQFALQYLQVPPDKPAELASATG